MFKERRIVYRKLEGGGCELGPCAYGTSEAIAANPAVRVDLDALRDDGVRGLFERHVLDCVRSGSDFLATDTFPARALLRFFGGGKTFAAVVKEHLKIVVEVYEQYGFVVPSCIYQAFGPVGDCYKADAGVDDARVLTREQIAYGVEGVGVVDQGFVEVLFETVPSGAKFLGTVLGIMDRVKKWPKGHRLPPFTVSLVLDSEGHFRDGGCPVDCLREVLALSGVKSLCASGGLKFGLNCVGRDAVNAFWSELFVSGVVDGVDYCRLFDYLAPNGAEGNPWEAEERVLAGEEVLKSDSRPFDVRTWVSKGVAKRVAACCGLGHADLRSWKH